MKGFDTVKESTKRMMIICLCIVGVLFIISRAGKEKTQLHNTVTPSITSTPTTTTTTATPTPAKSTSTYHPTTTTSNKTATTYSSSSKGNRATEAWVCAQDIVKSNLKSPSTAKFCSYTEATVTCTGGNDYTIKGYVDADNSYGASIRNNFTVTLTLTEKGYTNGYASFS